MLENFLEAEIAKQALEQFPSFDRKSARDEFGRESSKHVVEDLSLIGPVYHELADYIASSDFLLSMERLTGIEGLHNDPNMFGGGTHENRHGQKLDTHVDFNYDPKTGRHRRVNLLVFLNQEWQDEWGGQIQLHSHPRQASKNTISSYTPLFNRAVIFETSERSWHGFPQIILPESKRSLSRKSISIYLYSDTRPAEEIAPPHGTFYILPSLPDRISEGHSLSSEDVSEIESLLAGRDQWLEHYQKLEMSLNQEILRLKDFQRAPVLGVAKMQGESSGFYHDGWVAPEASLNLSPVRPVHSLSVNGSVPSTWPKDLKIEVWLESELLGEITPQQRAFQRTFPIRRAITEVFKVEFRTKLFRNLSVDGQSEDSRDLAFILDNIHALGKPQGIRVLLERWLKALFRL